MRVDDDNFFDLAEVLCAKYRDALSNNAALREQRDRLRDVVEALLGVLGKTVPADEIVHWRKLAGLSEIPAETPP